MFNFFIFGSYIKSPLGDLGVISFIPQTIHWVPRCRPPTLPTNRKQSNTQSQEPRQGKNPPTQFSFICKVLQPFIHGVLGNWRGNYPVRFIQVVNISPLGFPNGGSEDPHFLLITSKSPHISFSLPPGFSPFREVGGAASLYIIAKSPISFFICSVSTWPSKRLMMRCA